VELTGNYIWVPFTTAEYEAAALEGRARAARFTERSRHTPAKLSANNINGRMGELAVLKWGMEHLSATTVADVADDPAYDGDVLVGDSLQLEVKAAAGASMSVDAAQLLRTAAVAYVWCRLPQESPPGIYLAGWTPTEVARLRAHIPEPPLPPWYLQLGEGQVVQDGDDFPEAWAYDHLEDNTMFVNVAPRPMSALVAWLTDELAGK